MVQQTLSKIEAGSRGVTLEDALSIASGLGVPLSDLVPMRRRPHDHLSRRRKLEINIKAEERQIAEMESQVAQTERAIERSRTMLARMRAQLDVLEATEE